MLLNFERIKDKDWNYKCYKFKLLAGLCDGRVGNENNSISHPSWHHLEGGREASSLSRILLKRYLSVFGGKDIGLSMKIEDICPCDKSPPVQDC